MILLWIELGFTDCLSSGLEHPLRGGALDVAPSSVVKWSRRLRATAQLQTAPQPGDGSLQPASRKQHVREDHSGKVASSLPASFTVMDPEPHPTLKGNPNSIHSKTEPASYYWPMGLTPLWISIWCGLSVHFHQRMEVLMAVAITRTDLTSREFRAAKNFPFCINPLSEKDDQILKYRRAVHEAFSRSIV